MTLLDWTIRHFEAARPWKPEGCSLRPPSRKWLNRYEEWKILERKKLLDMHEKERSAEWAIKESLARFDKRVSNPLVGVNRHGVGRFQLERQGMIYDIPFRFAQELVYDRDDGYCCDCHGCGHYVERKYKWNPNSYFSRWTTRIGAPVEEEFRATSSGSRNYDLSVHHIVPVSKMGSNCTENLKLLESNCHARYTAAQSRGQTAEDPRMIMRLDQFSAYSAHTKSDHSSDRPAS